MNDCIFCKIIAGEIPSKKLYEDELCLAFYDIQPLAPQHFLVVPKAHVASASELCEENAALVGLIVTSTSTLSPSWVIVPLPATTPLTRQSSPATSSALPPHAAILRQKTAASRSAKSFFILLIVFTLPFRHSIR